MKKLVMLVMGFSLCMSIAYAQSFKMRADVIGSGAADATSPDNAKLHMFGTIGQAVIGVTSNAAQGLVDGQGFWHAITGSTRIGVEITKNPGMPGDYQLFQNYPNPFNPTTTIRFSVPSHSHVALKVYSMTGSLVKTLVDENYAAGEYSVVFTASEIPTGSYLYTLEAGGHLMTKRMILIK
jgi:hypothetical protein